MAMLVMAKVLVGFVVPIMREIIMQVYQIAIAMVMSVVEEVTWVAFVVI